MEGGLLQGKLTKILYNCMYIHLDPRMFWELSVCTACALAYNIVFLVI